MAKEPTTTNIAGNTYIIGDWDVDKALETLVWLSKTFGEGFLSLFMSPEGEGFGDLSEGKIQIKEDQQDVTLIKDFASKVIENLEPKEYVKYAKLIVNGTKRNGKDINFSMDFIGKMSELHQVLFAVLRHQYGDFLEGNAEGE